MNWRTAGSPCGAPNVIWCHLASLHSAGEAVCPLPSEAEDGSLPSEAEDGCEFEPTSAVRAWPDVARPIAGIARPIAGIAHEHVT